MGDALLNSESPRCFSLTNRRRRLARGDVMLWYKDMGGAIALMFCREGGDASNARHVGPIASYACCDGQEDSANGRPEGASVMPIYVWACER